MTRLASFLIKDLEGDWSKPSIKFFRSNGAYGYVIWLTIINTYLKKKKLLLRNLLVMLKNMHQDELF